MPVIDRVSMTLIFRMQSLDAILTFHSFSAFLRWRCGERSPLSRLLEVKDFYRVFISAIQTGRKFNMVKTLTPYSKNNVLSSHAIECKTVWGNLSLAMVNDFIRRS